MAFLRVEVWTRELPNTKQSPNNWAATFVNLLGNKQEICGLKLSSTLQSFVLFNTLKHSGNYVTPACILPREYIYVFRVILTVNSDYFLKQR
jgi:hypothetical protein